MAGIKTFTSAVRDHVQVLLNVVLNLNVKSLETLHFLFHVLRIIKTLMGEVLQF